MSDLAAGSSMPRRPQVCAEHTYFFVNETATLVQPTCSQRRDIRSHVMKRFKLNERRTQQELRATRRLKTAKDSSKQLQEVATPYPQQRTYGDSESRSDFSPQELVAAGSRIEQLQLSAYEVTSAQRSLSHVPQPLTRPKILGDEDGFDHTESPSQDDSHPPRTRPRCCVLCGALQEDLGTEYSLPRVRQNSAEWQLVRTEFISSPLQILGAARADPFRSYPIKEMKPTSQELMDHAVSYLLPGLVPDVSKDEGNAVSKAWFGSGLTSPLLFHALVFAGSIHRDFLRHAKIYPNAPVALSHKIEVIRLLNEVLGDPDTSLRDDVLLAILILASHETMDTAGRQDNPFNSPLKSAQWINVYGSILYVPEHMKAVMELVALRGGLENLRLRGLAETIVAGDIIASTNSMSRPTLPPLQSSERWIGYVTKWVTSIPRSPTQRLGKGFLRFQIYGITPDLIYVCNVMGDVTIAIEHYLQGETGALSLGVIAKARTAIQHRLLSIPEKAESRGLPLECPDVYESCHITALLYSLAVIFPISNAHNVLRAQMRRLQTVLEYSRIDPAEADLYGLLLWMLVLGGIAALDEPERAWYVTQLVKINKLWRINSWENVVRILKLFLWLDSACDLGGRILWMEVMDQGAYLEAIS